jgi:WD40 repeat protein
VWSLEQLESQLKDRSEERGSDMVRELVVSKDGKYAAALTLDGELQVWRLNLPSKIWSVKLDRVRPEVLGFSSDGKRLSAVMDDGQILVWPSLSGKVRSIAGVGSVRSAALDESARLAAVLLRDDGVLVWDVKQGKLVKQLRKAPRLPLEKWAGRAVTISPNGAWVAVSLPDHRIFVWETTGGRQLVSTTCQELIYDLAISPDGSRLVTTCERGNLRLWDCKTAECIHTFKTDLEKNPKVRFLDNGHTVITHALSQKVDQLRFWDLDERREYPRSVKTFGLDSHFTVTASGRRVLTADFRLGVWDAYTGELLMSFTPDEHLTRCAATPDGHTIVCGDMAGDLHFFAVTAQGSGGSPKRGGSVIG